MSSSSNDTIQINNQTFLLSDITHKLSSIEELANTPKIAFADGEETLVLAFEADPALMEDRTVFCDYVIPSIDEKVMELMSSDVKDGKIVRLYLEPGIIEKLSGKSVERDFDFSVFLTESLDGLLSRLPRDQEEEATGIAAVVIDLFRKIVEQEPVMDEPFLDLGGDSIKVLEFLETLQEKHPIPGQDILDLIAETTTLKDIIGWLES